VVEHVQVFPFGPLEVYHEGAVKMILDSPELTASSTLREEGLGDLLVMDWWFDTDMDRAKKPDKSLDEAGVQRLRTGIAADVVAALSKQKPNWWNRPWSIALGSAILGGTVVLLADGVFSHHAEDLKRDIGLDITRQLNERSAADSENLNNRIAKEVGRELEPVNQQLHTLNQDIGKIKDNLRIARTTPPGSSPLVAFSGMSPRELATSLPALRKALERPPQSDSTSEEKALRTVSQRLGEMDGGAPGYWTTVAAIINYQSLVNQLRGIAPDPSLISRPCAGLTMGTGGGNTISGFTVRGCLVDLDTTFNKLVNITFRDSVVRYHGGAVDLQNVTFVNCRFELIIPPDTTPKRPNVLRAILGSGDQKSITVSSD